MITKQQTEHVTFNYDPEFRICILKWTGNVPTEEFKEAIGIGRDFVAGNEGPTRILLDRRALGEYSTESRVWLKQDFMRNEGKVLIKKVDKLASVAPSTTFASVMTTVFSAIFQIANPNLQYQVFDNAEDAMAWLKDEKRETKKRFLERVFSIFKSAETVEQG